MKKYLFILFAVFCSLGQLQSQVRDSSYVTKDELIREIGNLHDIVSSLRNQINSASSRDRIMNASMENLTRKSDSLGQELFYTKAEIDQLIDSLNININTIIKNDEANKEKMKQMTEKLDRSYLHWIIALLIITIFVFVLFIVQSRKLKLNTKSFYKESLNELIEQNNQTKKMILLHEVMANLPLKDRIKGKVDGMEDSFLWMGEPGKDSIDHNLAIKLGIEIQGINKLVKKMKNDSPGKNNLDKMMKKLEKVYKECGYEAKKGKIFYLGEELN